MRILDLPQSLLVLLAATSLPTPIHANGLESLPPPHAAAVRDLPEAESPWKLSETDSKALLRRELAVAKKMEVQKPVAVRKMSADPDEKFWPEYWGFGEMFLDITTTSSGNGSADLSEIANLPFLPPLLAHSSSTLQPRGVFDALLRRQTGYTCPTNTYSCSALGSGYATTCCTDGWTCSLVADSSAGSVGCCAAGQTCVGAVASCNTAAGYTPCANVSSSDGCCQPGFTCDATGCIARSTTTVTGAYVATVISAASASSSISTTTTTISPSSTTTTALATVVVVTATVTVYPTSATPTTTVFVTSYVPTTTLSSTPGLISTSTTTTTVTASISTTSPISTITSTISASTSASQGLCPGGFYACSAYYAGGCCQVGRDCAKTNCPQSIITQTINSGNVVTILVIMGSGASTVATSTASGTTIVVAGGGVSTTTTTASSSTGTGTAIAVSTTTVGTSATTNVAQGSCATGWFTCAAGLGGGCCPTGYSCASAVASCVATQSGEPGKVYKVGVSGSGAVVRVGVAWIVTMVCLGAGLVIL